MKTYDDTLKEYIEKYLKENFSFEYGIDIDDENKLVSFNPSHQENVDTNNLYTPKPIYNEVNGYRVISIFERKTNLNGNDGNPLLYAFKGIKGWKFNNIKYDYFALLRRFVAVCKELNEHFDVIITTPSSNPLNTNILHKVIRIIPHDVYIEKFFYKMTAEEAYEYTMAMHTFDKIADKKLGRHLEMIFEKGIGKMYEENDGIFSYKYLPSDVRTLVANSMKIDDSVLSDVDIYNTINDKNVLVIDDTVTSGKTISDSASTLLNHFSPKSITFLTLFSPLSK